MTASRASVRQAPLVTLILNASANAFGVTVSDVTGPGRFRHMIYARQCAAYLLRAKAGLSFPSIGSVLNRDHSTVMHAHRAVEDGHADDVVVSTARKIALGLDHPPARQELPRKLGPVAVDDRTAKIMQAFAYHPPSTQEIAQAHQQVRDTLMQAAVQLTTICPPGEDLDRALTDLRSAMHWANASIAIAQATASSTQREVHSA